MSQARPALATEEHDGACVALYYVALCISLECCTPVKSKRQRIAGLATKAERRLLLCVPIKTVTSARESCNVRSRKANVLLLPILFRFEVSTNMSLLQQVGSQSSNILVV